MISADMGPSPWSPKSLRPAQSPDNDSASRLREIAATACTGIDPDSGLASDFLNQFNEVSMLLDLSSEDPEMLEELADWAPRGYVEHFEASNFRDSALVLEAYRLCPIVTRGHFDRLAAELCTLIDAGLASIRRSGVDGHEAESASKTLAADVRQQIDALSALIHPTASAPRPAEISALFAARR